MMACALALAAILSWLAPSSGVAAPSARSERPSDPGGAAPARSDVRRIVFSAASEDRSSIYTVHPEGRGLRRLTQTTSEDFGPVWSPDGRRVAFSRYRGFSPPRADLYVMDADGSRLRRLTNPRRKADHDPAWSPDGKTIAFVRRPFVSDNGGESSAIFTVDVASKRIRRLTDPASRSDDAVWSPDGQSIAYQSAFEDDMPPDPSLGHLDVWVMDRDGSDKRNITGDSNGSSPAWSPDGAQVAYERDDAGDGSDIWITDPSGDAHTELTTGCEYKENPTWAPGGDLIAYETNVEGCRRDEDEIARSIWTVDVNVPHRSRELTPGFRVAVDPSWSPSGRQIAFIGIVRSRSELYVAELDASTRTRLTYTRAQEASSSWGSQSGE